jgi:uncharacterized protein (TIGR03435 family)
VLLHRPPGSIRALSGKLSHGVGVLENLRFDESLKDDTSMTTASVCVWLAGFLSGAVYGQVTPEQPRFDVASLRRMPSSTGPASITENNGGIRYTATLGSVIRRAYGVEPYRLIGPSWLGSVFYELTANLPEGSSKEQIPAMLRQLLAERTHLSVHRENRETPVYALIVGNGGLKLKPTQASSESSSVTALNPLTGRTHIEAPMTMSALASFLSANMDRRVLDMTGVDGQFAVMLDARSPVLNNWPTATPPRSADEPLKDWILPNGKKLPGDAPPIFSEIQKLGLKLDPRRAPIEYIVVDKVDKDPADN